MIKWIIRILLLLSLIAIALLFTRSEQFGVLESKVVSLDFSANGGHLGVSTNHALWKYDADYQRRLNEFNRKIHAIDLSARSSRILLDEPIPVAGQIEFVEWLRVLGERPNYEIGIMPFSPVQFVSDSDQLAFFNFQSNCIETENLADGSTDTLVRLKLKRGGRRLTPGWFLLANDGKSLIVEDTELKLHRFELGTEILESKLPIGEPFYVDSQNLALGAFVDLRILGNIREPTPIYGASCHPNEAELAIATVLQICFTKFDGDIPRRLLSHKMEVGSTIHYSPDGKLMAACFRDIIRFFSTKEQKTKVVITNAEELITAFAFSPNNQLFATGDNQGVVRVWDMSNFELINEYRLRGDWRVHWFIPYGCGFVWVILAIASLGTGRKKKRKPDFFKESSVESADTNEQPDSVDSLEPSSPSSSETTESE